MAATGQTINDRLNAVRYALVGQGLARTVCKATTEEIIGPKKKHIDYLLACTNEPNVSIPQLANLLIERTQHASWAVVFKSLISIHHLMSYGNERFTQYLATSNHSFELNDFMDRTTPQGYNMSTFVRRYAKYINDKSISYRTLAIDLCKIRSGNDNALRTMNMDNLSKTLPIVQTQFDSLLEFGAETKDLNNGVIMSAFRLLYKDLVRLYVAYQEAIINLLERYFKLSRRKTREALDMYKNYLTRMDKVAGFLRVVDAVGLDKSEMPDLTKSPASILEILEKHLAQLDAKKRGATPTGPEANEEATETSANKENELPATSSKIGGEHSAEAASSETLTEKRPTSPKATQRPQQPSPASGESTINDKTPLAPKKPPARPSPIVSPKASPSGSKPPPSDAAGASSSAPLPVVNAEKKAPPERPAKPPSRPPPPSSSAAQTKTQLVAAPPLSSSSAATESSSAGAPAAPPPPPKPTEATKTASPTLQPSAAQSQQTTHVAASASSNNQEPEPEALHTAEAEIPQEDGHGSNHDTQRDNGGDRTTTMPACLTVVTDETVQEESHDDQAVETNHITNSVNNNHDAIDDEMPPPPPPIDDDAELGPPPVVGQQVDAAQAQEQAPPVQQQPEQEPQVNGRNGDNNGVAGG